MVKIYLVVSNKSLQEIVRECRYPYLLYSFWYIKSSKFNPFPKLSYETVMIDSGAHSIQQGVAKDDWDKFFKSYLTFLIENEKSIDYAVELDIEEMVGMEKVEQWREELISSTNLPIIPVWHKKRGFNYWEEMCKKYDYVGFSGFLKRGVPEVPEKYLPKFFKVADKYKTKVHGFGYTRFKSKLICKFYSVDSSSWVNFARFVSRPLFISFKHKSAPKYSFKGNLPTRERLRLGAIYYKHLLERWDK